MSYTPHVLFSFGGSWSSDPAEIWECSVRLSADGGGGVTLDPEAYLSGISAALFSWYQSTAASMNALATLAFIKANHIGADGKYVDKTTTHVHDFTPAAGALSPVGPGFLSIAYSWYTANARGPGHSGRIFPPNNTNAPSVGAFQVSSSVTAAYATSAALLLGILKNSAGAPGAKGTPIIASKVNGAIVPIVGATVNSVYDVQRRRKNRIKGTRSAAHVPA